MIRYEDAPDIKEKISSLVSNLSLDHVEVGRVACIRSRGSSSRNIIARCHALPKIMQHALNTPAHYIIEIISEKFDRMPEDEQTKTLIHELLHIPKSFGGGFIHHNMVNSATVNRMMQKLKGKTGIQETEEPSQGRRWFFR